jgi:hypothetical protein
MISKETARHFADEWIAAWNSHDIDTIMSHYDTHIEFTSPMIVSILGIPDGTIRHHQELRDYFLKGLAAYPDLKFELYNVLSGVDSVVIHYKSVKNLVGAEVFILNDASKAVRCFCNYMEVL